LEKTKNLTERIRRLLSSYPILSLIVSFQLLRLAILPFMGLMPQDAYYYFYGQHLDWSYFDHPGMIGYLLRFATDLFGSTVTVVKMTDFTVSSLSIWVFYSLSKNFLSPAKHWVAMLLASSSILWSMLSLNSTPDVPLVLFWSLSLWSLEKALFKSKSIHWLLAGLWMGLAFNSKYTAVLLPFGLMLFLLLSPTQRKKLLQAGPWLSLIVCCAVAYPVYYWNAQNDFVSFAFQSTGRSNSVSDFGFKPKLLGGFIATQMALVFPAAFLTLVILCYKYIKRIIISWKLPSDKTLFLGAFFLPTFLGFLLLSPFYWIKINWLVPSYISGFILLAYFFKRKWIRSQIIISIVIHLLILVELTTYIVPIRSDDTWWGWEALSEEVSELRTNYPDHFFFSTDNYKTAAVLRFYQDAPTYSTNVIGENGLQFGILDPDLSFLEGQNAILIDSDTRFKNEAAPETIPAKVIPYFKDIQILAPIILRNKQGKAIRKFNVFACMNYKKP